MHLFTLDHLALGTELVVHGPAYFQSAPFADGDMSNGENGEDKWRRMGSWKCLSSPRLDIPENCNMPLRLNWPNSLSPRPFPHVCVHECVSAFRNQAHSWNQKSSGRKRWLLTKGDTQSWATRVPSRSFPTHQARCCCWGWEVHGLENRRSFSSRRERERFAYKTRLQFKGDQSKAKVFRAVFSLRSSHPSSPNDSNSSDSFYGSLRWRLSPGIFYQLYLFTNLI